jgi:signal peptidase I
MQISYIVRTNQSGISSRTFDKLGVPVDDRRMDQNHNYDLTLTPSQVEQLRKLPMVLDITPVEYTNTNLSSDPYPQGSQFGWTRDNYGPILIPKKGMTIELNPTNILIYSRVITAYEGHTLHEQDGKYLIDGKPQTSYTVAMDYYWMMGDNRHRSSDSRFWGFVPQDHIVGKAKFIWMSTDKDKSFFSRIRWNRLFKVVK